LRPSRIERIRAWLEETHSVEFELFRHFLGRLFESEFVAAPGQMRGLLAGVVAIVASLGGIVAQVFFHKYVVLHQFDTAEPFHRALLADILFCETFVMLTAGLFTTVEWTSLFPALRDYLALAALPVRMRQIFLAKFASLAAFALFLLLTLTLAPSFIFPNVIRGKYLESTFLYLPSLFVSSYLAGVFVFFSLVALEGAILNITPVRHFPKVSLTVQGLLVLVLVGGIPFALSIPNLYPYVHLRPGWLLSTPPLWFTGVQQVMIGNSEPMAVQLAHRAWLASALAFCCAVAAYWWSYRRHRTRVLESPSVEAAAEAGWILGLLERLIPSARRLAIFSFTAKTLRRSQHHRLILTAFAAIALALIVEGFLGLAANAHSAFRQAAVAIPLALSLFLLAGLRYLFRLPVELRANWIFRMESAGEGLELLRGAEAFLWYVILVPLAALTLVAEIAMLGPQSGLFAALLCILSSGVLLNLLLFSWERIPFTSSYLPGQRPLVDVVIGYGLATIVYISSLASLISWACEESWRAVVLALFLLVAEQQLRRARRTHLLVHSLVFEELPEPVVRTLSIEKD
jgi:hypothetical protein